MFLLYIHPPSLIIEIPTLEEPWDLFPDKRAEDLSLDPVLLRQPAFQALHLLNCGIRWKWEPIKQRPKIKGPDNPTSQLLPKISSGTGMEG